MCEMQEISGIANDCTGSRPVWLQIFRRVCGLLCFRGPTGLQSPGVAAVSVCTHSGYMAQRVGPCGLCNRESADTGRFVSEIIVSDSY